MSSFFGALGPRSCRVEHTLSQLPQAPSMLEAEVPCPIYKMGRLFGAQNTMMTSLWEYINSGWRCLKVGEQAKVSSTLANELNELNVPAHVWISYLKLFWVQAGFLCLQGKEVAANTREPTMAHRSPKSQQLQDNSRYEKNQQLLSTLMCPPWTICRKQSRTSHGRKICQWALLASMEHS